MKLTIKSYNGLNELGSSLITDIRQISVGFRDGLIRIGLLTSDNRSSTIEITRPLENFKFLGLSHIPYTLGNYYKQGVGWIDVDINEDTTLYEMLAPITEVETPSDNIGIICYRNTAEPNLVNKIQFLERLNTIRGTFREGFSLTEPTIILTSEAVPNFNYVYIAVLNRYYYVNSINNISKNLWEVELSVDVLMSWKTEIGNINAFVDRNEFSYNPLIINKELPIEQGYNIVTRTVGNELFYKSYGTAVNSKSFKHSYIISGVALDLDIMRENTTTIEEENTNV